MRTKQADVEQRQAEIQQQVDVKKARLSQLQERKKGAGTR